MQKTIHVGQDTIMLKTRMVTRQRNFCGYETCIIAYPPRKYFDGRLVPMQEIMDSAFSRYLTECR